MMVLFLIQNVPSTVFAFFLSSQVTTLCRVKEGEPAPGDLDAEARHLADEAKNLVSVTFDISKMSP